jgi:Ca-activated chloride channel homolog
MSFASPLLLVLLALLPALALLWVREERMRTRKLAALVDAGLLSAMVSPASPARRALRRGLALLGLALLLVALAGPRIGSRTILLPQKGLDVLFVIDVSRSMRARDVLPDRLERAKAEIGSVIDRLVEHRVGVVAFAGSAFVQCPLTTDKEAVRLFLNALNPDTVPQGGTSIGAGLEVALNALRAEAEALGGHKPAGRVVVVITDGEDHEGGLEEVAKSLREEGVQVLLVGVGSTLGEPIPVTDTSNNAPSTGSVTGYMKDRTGNTVMTRMNPQVLTEVAGLVGGTFIDGTNEPDLGLRELEARVATLEKRDLEARTHVEHEDRTTAFLLGALLLLWLCAIVPERARARRERSLGVVP